MSSFASPLGSTCPHSQTSTSRPTERSTSARRHSGSSIPPLYELMYIEMNTSFERLRRRKLSPRSEERNNQEFLYKMKMELSDSSSSTTSPTPSSSILCSSSPTPSLSSSSSSASSSSSRSQSSGRVNKTRKRREGIKVIQMHNGSIQASFKLDDSSSEMYMGTIRHRRAAVSHASTSMISYVNPSTSRNSPERSTESGSASTNSRQ